jgi:hypothetical protein
MDGTQPPSDITTTQPNASPSQNRFILGVGALFDDKHFVFCGAEIELTHEPGVTQFGALQLFEARHNARAGSDGDQLNLHTAHPTHRRKT